MNSLRGVVWKEGGHLTPQHFQAQSRHYRDSIWFTVEATHFAPYGLIGSLEEDAGRMLHGLSIASLSNGKVELSSATGIFPGGLEFEVGSPDSPSPEPLTISGTLRHDSGPFTIYLVFVEPGRDWPVTTESPARGEPVRDINTGVPGAPVAFSTPALKLMAFDHAPDDCTHLPLGRISQDSSGNLFYDAEFIPPCITIGASSVLLNLGLRIVELLEDRIEAVQQRRQPPNDQASLEVVGFLQTVIPAVTRLREMCAGALAPPLALYLELAILAGGLCTFLLDSTPERIPPYDHDRLGPCFLSLEQFIRAHLHAFAPVNVVSIPLIAKGDGIYEGEIKDLRCLGPSQWVLSLRPAEARFAETLSRLERTIKVASSPTVRELRNASVGGLAIKHVRISPGAVMPRPFHEYFLVDVLGDAGRQFWADMERTRTAGVYIPPQAGADPELQVILRPGERA